MYGSVPKSCPAFYTLTAGGLLMCLPAKARGRKGGAMAGAGDSRTLDDRALTAVELTHEFVQILDVEGWLLHHETWTRAPDSYTARHPVKIRWIDFWDDSAQAVASSALDEAKSGKVATFQGSSCALDGLPRWWDVVVTSMPDQSAPITRVLVNAREITQLKHTADELARARRDLDEVRAELLHVARLETSRILSGGISHELKQPLAAIRSNAKHAARVLEQTHGEMSAILKDIVQDTERASQIIDRFRAFMQRGSLVRESCDLDAMVVDIVPLLRPEATQRHIRLEAHVAGASNVFADRVLLQQLLVNLLSNAFDAVDDPAAVGRVVTLRTTRGRIGALVSIEDQGPIASDDSVRRLDEPFYSSKAGGSGLGLSICRHILALHGSQLRMARNSGGGLVFSFELPNGRPH
jgi:C4-dicarboxylate-specific signal transduction histidine kinase